MQKWQTGADKSGKKKQAILKQLDNGKCVVDIVRLYVHKDEWKDYHPFMKYASRVH